MMNDEGNKLNILLVEDAPGKSELIRSALAHSGNSCNLHTVGSGRHTIKYLRGEGPYAAAPKPDLVFLDATNCEPDQIKILDQVHADTNSREIPLVLLTSPESEQFIDETYNQKNDNVVFSAIELNSFLRTMCARTPDRFLNAVTLIQKLGFVLVRIPGEPATDEAMLPVAATH